MFRKLSFIFRLAGQDLKGNIGVHAVGAAIIAAAFLTLGLFILAAVNLRGLSRYWQERIQLCIYLEPGLAQADEKRIESKLNGFSGIDGVSYISRDQALADFKAMLGDDSELIDGLDENPLPASFVARLKPEARDIDNVKQTAAAITVWPGVDEVDYGGPLLENFSAVIQAAQAAVVIIGGLITLAVVFIISNTIRLTMYSRRDEIAIMRLVGASNLLIRMPFIMEGVLQGTTAALIGLGLLYAIYRLGLGGLPWPGLFAGYSPEFLPGDWVRGLVIGGAALGAGGSLARLRDFLKV